MKRKQKSKKSKSLLRRRKSRHNSGSNKYTLRSARSIAKGMKIYGAIKLRKIAKSVRRNCGCWKKRGK